MTATTWPRTPGYGDVVDLDRYPIGDPAGPAYLELVRACRDQLRGHGRDVDDRAALPSRAAGTHRAEGVLDAQRRTEHVAFENPAGILGVEVHQQAGDLHPGVVDQDVQAAEAVYGLGNRPLPARLRGDVQRHELGLRAGLTQRVCAPIAQVLLDVADDDGRTRASERLCHPFAEPAGPAGHQCLSPVQVVHAHQAPLSATFSGFAFLRLSAASPATGRDVTRLTSLVRYLDICQETV